MKRIIIITSCIFACAAILLACIANSSLQTALANKILSENIPEAKISKLDIGLREITVGGLKLPVQNGDIAEMESLSVRYCFFALFEKKIKILELNISNANYALAPRTQSQSTQKIADKNSDAKSKNAEGEKSARSTNAQNQSASWSWNIELDKAAINAGLSGDGGKVRIKAEISKLAIDKNFFPESAEIDIAINAFPKNAPASEAFFKAEVIPENGARKISAKLDLNAKELLRLSGQCHQHFDSGNANLKIDIDDKLISSLTAGIFSIPNFRAAMDAAIKFNGGKARSTLSFDGDFAMPNTSAISGIKIADNFNFKAFASLSADAKSAQIDNANLKLFAGANLLACAETKRPFCIGKNFEFPEGELLAVEANIPKKIISQFFNNGAVDAERLKLSALLKGVQDGKISADASAALEGISITSGKRPILSGAELRADMVALLDISKNPKCLQISKLNAESRISGKSFVEAKSTKEVSLYLDRSAKIPQGELADIKLDIPVSVFASFIPNMEIDAQNLWGEMILSADADGTVNLSTKNGAQLDKLSLRSSSGGILSDANLKADLKAYLKPDFSGGAAIKISAGSKNREMAEATADISLPGKDRLCVSISGNADIPALLSQPALKVLEGLSSGKLDIKLFTDGKSAELSASAKDLKNANNTNLADSISLNASANIIGGFSNAEGKATIEIAAPSGMSDASLNFKKKENISFNIVSNKIYVDDLLGLMEVLSRSSAEPESPLSAQAKSGIPHASRSSTASDAKARTGNESAANESACWYIGSDIIADAELKLVMFRSNPVLEKLKLSALCNSSEICLERLSAEIYGAPLSGSAKAIFTPGNGGEYSLENAKLSLANFHSEKLFSDKSNPPISGAFDIDVSLYGKAKSLKELPASAAGQAEIKSGGGFVKILSEDSKAGKITKAAGTAAKIANAIFSDRVKELGGISELTDILSKLKYNSAEVLIIRSPETLDLSIKKAVFNTPQIILSASGGKILSDGSDNLKNYKLDIPVSTYVAKGNMWDLFRKCGLAGNSESDIYPGYYNGASFNVGGTVSSPENDMMSKVVSRPVLTGESLLKKLFK